MITFPIRPDQWEVQMVGRVAVFFAPVILLIGLYSIGISFKIELFSILIYWVLIEALLFYFFIRDVENKKSMPRKLLGGMAYSVGPAFGSFIIHDDEMDYEENERYQHAAIALLSMLIPLSLLVLFGLLIAFLGISQ